MGNAAVDRIGRDVLLAGDVERAVRVWNDPPVHVAVRAADVNVRARVVGDQRGVVTAPGAGEILGRSHARQLAGTERDGERGNGDG